MKSKVADYIKPANKEPQSAATSRAGTPVRQRVSIDPKGKQLMGAAAFAEPNPFGMADDDVQSVSSYATNNTNHRNRVSGQYMNSAKKR